jgi:hypothetical protein
VTDALPPDVTSFRVVGGYVLALTFEDSPEERFVGVERRRPGRIG